MVKLIQYLHLKKINIAYIIKIKNLKINYLDVILSHLNMKPDPIL